MIRVLFLLSHTEKGGGEVVVYNLVKRLDRRRFDPLVGHVDVRRGDFIHEFHGLGITPVDFRAGRLRNPLHTAAVIWRLARFLRHQVVDAIVTSGAHNHVYAALAARIVGVPIVTYVMNQYAPRRRDNPWIVRAALRLGADHYVAASRACLEPLDSLIPRETPRAVVYHGVDEDLLVDPPEPAAARLRLGMGAGERLVTVIGRLQRWKGQDVFVRAAAEVNRACPEARFAVVGGGLFGLETGFREELRRLIIDLGLVDRCRLVGHQANVRDWMVASDVVVHAARAPEPGANVVMEAMALGRPVVASACGAPTEIIEDGADGLLFKPGDPGDLASQILRLLHDLGLAEKLGRAAAERVARDFTATGMAASLGAAIEGVAPAAPDQDDDHGRQTVLFTLSACRRAGHEMSVRNMIKVLDKTSFRPLAVFLCLDPRGSFPDELRSLGATVVVRPVKRLRNPANVLRSSRWLARLIRKHRVSLVVTSGGHNHPYARIAALMTGTPTICHENFLFKAPFWLNGPIYGMNFLLGAEVYFSGGRQAADTIRAANPRSVPVVYHPHMMDFDLFDWRRGDGGLRRRLGIPERGVVYAMVGRIQDWKGQGVFIRAALDLLDRCPDAHFVIAGGGWWPADERLESELKQLVSRRAAAGRIHFTGFLDDPVPVFAMADVICHCSTQPEPTGTVIIEALAMKKAVISVHAGGPLELLRPGVDGLLVPPNDIRALAVAMERCYREPTERRAMGERGYSRVRTDHSEQSFTASVNTLLARYAAPSARVRG